MSPKPKSLTSCSREFSKWWYRDLNSFHLGYLSSSACSFQGITLVCIKQVSFARTELMTRRKSPVCSHPLVRSPLGFMNSRNWPLLATESFLIVITGSWESSLPFPPSVPIWGVKKILRSGILDGFSRQLLQTTTVCLCTLYSLIEIWQRHLSLMLGKI